jgi:transcriptional regulator with XRE-family HTH domain
MTVSSPGVKVAATNDRQRLTFALQMALDRQRAGAELAALREEARMTQAELVEKTGLSLRQIQRYEAGESMPRWKNLDKLAEALGPKVYEIVRDDDAGGEPVTESDGTPDVGSDVEDRLERIEKAIADLTKMVRGSQPAQSRGRKPQGGGRRRGSGGS